MTRRDTPPQDFYAESVESKRRELVGRYDRELLLRHICARAEDGMRRAHAAGATHMSEFSAYPERFGAELRGRIVGGATRVVKIKIFPQAARGDISLFLPFSKLVDIARFKLMGREAFVERQALRLMSSLAAEEAFMIDQGQLAPPPALAALAERRSIEAAAGPAAPAQHSKPRSL